MRKCGKCGGTGHNARTCGTSKSQGSNKKSLYNKNWTKNLTNKLAAVASEPEKVNEEKSTESEPVGAKLPGVDIADSVDISGDESFNQEPGKAKEETNETVEDKKEEPKVAAEEKNLNGEELAIMGAGAWVGILQAGTQYANDQGYFGIDGPFLKMNFDAMKIILNSMLKDSSIDPETYAAYVVAGSGAWVSGNCYYAYKKANPSKKNNPAETVIDANFSKGTEGTNPNARPGEPGNPVALTIVERPKNSGAKGFT